jgi:multiple sugar transport system permease protein
VATEKITKSKAGQPRRLFGVEKRHQRTAFLFVLPALIMLLAITIYPLIRTLYLSVISLELSVSPNEQFVGLDNFSKAFSGDPRFWNAMMNTGILVLVGVTIQLLLGMGLALLASEMGRSRTIWVTLFMIPIMIAPVASGYQFRIIFSDTFGPLNYMVRTVSGGNISPPAWTADASTSLLTIMITDIWQWAPFMLLITLAGLESISPELLEAAKVDGGSYWQILRRIKIPMLLPIIIIGVLIRMMDTFKTFDLVFLLTGGGPGSSSETVAYYTYLNGFKFFSMGYTAALAFIQLVVIVFVSQIFLRTQRKRGEN